MALLEGQLQVRDLVLGKGTRYEVHSDFDPFSLSARAESMPRPWSHGSWSGAEWAEQRNVVFTVTIHGDNVKDIAGTIERRHALGAAFAPVGETANDVEFRFFRGGREYLLLGRPRRVEVDGSLVGTGKAYARCQFIAIDPRIYAATQGVETFGLPSFTGGLTVPLTAPFTVDGVLAEGFADLLNEGTTDTSLLIRIDGPVQAPRVALLRPDGQVETLQVLLDLDTGQWLTIETGSHTVLLQDTANRRSQVAGQFFQLPPGTSRMRFFADDYNDEAQVTVTWRSAWW